MSMLGNRRARGGRGTALRLAGGPSADLRSLLADRSVLSRLALGLLTVSALTVCVQSWKHSFPFRLNQRPADGVAAVIEFKRVNPDQTSRARDRAAQQVLPVFRHDARPLKSAPQELRTALVSFLTASSVSNLPVDTRRAFGLAAEGNLPPAGGLPAGDRTESFEKLKQIAADENQLRDLIDDFTRFIQPVEKTGLIVREHFAAELGNATQITVAGADGQVRTTSLAEVQLPALLAPTGILHGRWALFPTLLPVRYELEHWLKVQSPETLAYDPQATQAARQQAASEAKEFEDEYSGGNLLVKPGELIDDRKLELLQYEYNLLDAQVGTGERAVRVAIVFMLLLIVAALIGYYLARNEQALFGDIGRLSLYLGMLVLAVALGCGLSYDPWRAEVGPILVCVMVCAVVYSQMLATLTAFALCLIVAVTTGAELGRFTVLMSVCATAAILLPSVPSRSTLVVVGFWSGIAYFLMHWGTAVVEQQGITPGGDNPLGVAMWRDTAHWIESLRGAGWCLAAGFLVSGSLPFIEATFGAVTDISLLELGDVSHPLLQELVRRAPGTYNHSITVASIGETAADAIGANGLLVRVGAYFHDIGKMLKPHYFVENMTDGENRHDHLAPAMSTLIIIGHVKDGVDLAREHSLPRPVIDFVEQHHGTTLVEYFYHEAARLAEEDPDHRTDAEESNFRYPGPKPQTRETAVLMIADAVEGASRALSEPTPSRIERLVHDIALRRLLDGQFDECGLTLTELSRIEDSLTKSLTAMYHGRVKYPEPRTA
ncbi:MAG: HDIG domain-containing protein [Planctomycetia bacterium]|nr:HDIG domain-containing protein [Planctomycetia bacterium]